MITESTSLHAESTRHDDVAISVNGLTKVYKLYDSPLDRFKESINPFRKTYHRNFHALRDVSFEIKKGESIGIIGRNGSGKSTLLKTISGILTPTSGTVTVNGKVSALLELGAGFNPQLTGIENIYFNGTLLGYTRKELDAKLDDILSFADIGDFVHQQVQTYSSGMFVRLAFAVAINVDPDILIVDEALAVGDALIQKKCMDKMYDFKSAGKTILIVSHSTETVKSFVERGIVMNHGAVHFDGSSERAITEYFKLIFPHKNCNLPPKLTPDAEAKAAPQKPSAEPAPLEIFPSAADSEHTFGAGGAEIDKVSIFGLTAPNIFHGNDVLTIRISYSWDSDFLMQLAEEHGLEANLLFGMSFENVYGVTISGFSTSFAEPALVDVDPAAGTPECTFDFKIQLPELAGGDYFLTLGVSLGRQEKHLPLRRHRNLIQFKCVPIRKHVFGIMTFPLQITKIS